MLTTPSGRERAGCHAHLRRRFFDAQSAAPTLRRRPRTSSLDVYRIERAVLDADLLGTPGHLEMRETQSKAVMEEINTWLLAEQGRYPPRGPFGDAINYALGNWDGADAQRPSA